MKQQYKSIVKPAALAAAILLLLMAVRTVPAQPSVDVNNPRPVKYMGKPFSGPWQTRSENGGEFAMNLSRSGDNVTGTFKNADGSSTGTITGTVVNGTTLLFQWSQDGGVYKGSGKFILLTGNRHFTGSYSNTDDPHNTGAGKWYGWRPGESERPIKKLGKGPGGAG